MELHLRVTVPAFALSILSAVTTTVSWFLPSLIHDFVGIGMIGPAITIVALLGFLFSPVLVIPFGYWSGRNSDVTETYRSLLGLLALAGFVGCAIGGIIGGAIVVLGADIRLMSAVWTLIESVVTGTVYVVLGGFTGATLAQFRRAG